MKITFEWLQAEHVDPLLLHVFSKHFGDAVEIDEYTLETAVQHNFPLPWVLQRAVPRGSVWWQATSALCGRRKYRDQKPFADILLHYARHVDQQERLQLRSGVFITSYVLRQYNTCSRFLIEFDRLFNTGEAEITYLNLLRASRSMPLDWLHRMLKQPALVVLAEDKARMNRWEARRYHQLPSYIGKPSAEYVRLAGRISREVVYRQCAMLTKAFADHNNITGNARAILCV